MLVSRYTNKEHDESKNRFKEQLSQRYDKKAVQYIANSEEIESGSDNDL